MKKILVFLSSLLFLAVGVVAAPSANAATIHPNGVVCVDVRSKMAKPIRVYMRNTSTGNLWSVDVARGYCSDYYYSTWPISSVYFFTSCTSQWNYKYTADKLYPWSNTATQRTVLNLLC